MPITAIDPDPRNCLLGPLLEQVEHIVLGKQHQVELALACLLARGHLLIEDVPGVGKTTLAHALARVLGLQFQRIQFTSDLLPADVLGVSIYERETGTFSFHPGPIFAQLVLADEINRATPKTQSALLEAMEEGQITLEGVTRPLPRPFFVVATQNPAHQIGTFPLPESQLDRFLMRISLGYPEPRAERALLLGADRRELLVGLEPVLEPPALEVLQDRVPETHVSEAVLDYVQALVARTRQSGLFEHGLSPRAALGLLRAAQAWAHLKGRQYVLPDDVQAVFEPVAAHRLQARGGAGRPAGPEAIRQILEEVEVP
ncbi:MAG TPA: MoxR family ATPase [Chromatiales bacterium]|nr:MoxR family ATPase [Chromatiales bacterium]